MPAIGVPAVYDLDVLDPLATRADDYAGLTITNAGDVNADGYDDVVLGLYWGAEIGQTIHGSGGADSLFGGGGADQLYGSNGNDNLQGGNGNDLLEGGNGLDRLFGGAGNDILHGGTGDDWLDGGMGNNVLEGGAGNDTYFTRFGTDIVFDTDGLYDALVAAQSLDLDDYAGSGIEFFSLHREHAGGTISGTSGNDVIGATGWTVTLDGEAGDDQLTGADGSSEIFIGGLGSDIMSSGPKDFGPPDWGQVSGRDTFVFRDIAESTVGENRDVIEWFADSGTDWIDLRQIDANTARTGNQAFSLIAGDFTGTAGELKVELVGAGLDRDLQYNLVSGDVNGDGLADFEIEVHMQVLNRTLTAPDFFL